MLTHICLPPAKGRVELSPPTGGLRPCSRCLAPHSAAPENQAINSFFITFPELSLNTKYPPETLVSPFLFPKTLSKVLYLSPQCA